MILIGIVIVLLVLMLITLFKEINLGENGPNLGGTCLMFICLFGVVICCILGNSWSSNVTMHVTYDGTIEQYRSAVTMYGNKAELDVGTVITDFKYQGYQENMALFIRDLRTEIKEYNSILITKKMQKRNIVISWLIFYDEKLPLITLKMTE